jgi:hypothetical protein
MKLIISITMIVFSHGAFAKPFDLESYGAPQLYYSKEGIQQRQEQELQKQSNDVARQQLEVEKEQLRIQQEQLQIQKELIDSQ